MIIFLSNQCFAANLLQTFNQALTQDPTLAIAKAQLLAQEQNVPLKRAALLPNLTGNANYNRFSQSSIVGISNENTNFNVDLQQSIINLNQWYNYQAAGIANKSAQAQYNAALEDLIIRVAQAYLCPLQSIHPES